MPRNVVNSDGTLSDTLTGLVWQHQDDGVKKTWQEAVVYCQQLALGVQGSGWRLPSIDELRTLTQVFMFFSHPKSAPYWSSTPIAHSDHSRAFVVNHATGEMLATPKTEKHFVRPVRGEDLELNLRAVMRDRSTELRLDAIRMISESQIQAGVDLLLAALEEPDCELEQGEATDIGRSIASFARRQNASASQLLRLVEDLADSFPRGPSRTKDKLLRALQGYIGCYPDANARNPLRRLIEAADCVLDHTSAGCCTRMLAEIGSGSSTAPSPHSQAVEPGVTRLGREHRGEVTWDLYAATDSDSAQAFLGRQPVLNSFWCIFVRTPEGNWGRDDKGLFLEHLSNWQKDISLAECHARIVDDPRDLRDVGRAARGERDNFLAVIECPRCHRKWTDGIRYQERTAVRCSKCRTIAFVDSKDIVVGLDVLGMSVGRLPQWQKELSRAKCSAEIIPVSWELGAVLKAAAGEREYFLAEIKCGMCPTRWTDGVRYQDRTVVLAVIRKRRNLDTGRLGHGYVA